MNQLINISNKSFSSQQKILTLEKLCTSVTFLKMHLLLFWCKTVSFLSSNWRNHPIIHSLLLTSSFKPQQTQLSNKQLSWCCSFCFFSNLLPPIIWRLTKWSKSLCADPTFIHVNEHADQHFTAHIVNCNILRSFFLQDLTKDMSSWEKCF